jgi:sacsin
VGRLFSTLPLPILTGLPVHIHGLFSISADRSTLHGLDDRGVQDHRPKEWNKFLFQQMIPSAWAKLLRNVCQTYPTENHFHLWPTNRSDTHQFWYGLCRAVVDQVSQNHLPVWFTQVGHVALEDGLLASEETQLKAKKAFREAELPVMFVVNDLFNEARRRAQSRTLRPRTVYDCLQHLENFDKISRQSRLVILEFLLSEISLTDLCAFEIFPFADGHFRSLRQPPVFLHRNRFETTLFTRQLETNIDTNQLSDSASRLLHEGVKKNDQMVRYRTPEDLRDYFLNHIANGLGDTIVVDEDRISVLKQIWMWIWRYSKDRLPLSTLGALWLIPLRGSAVRKLVPLDTSNFVTWFPPGELNDLSLTISALDPGSALKILADDALSDEILQFLLSSADHKLSLHIRDGSKFENFVEFLTQDRSLLQKASEDVKNSVLRMLRQLPRPRNRVNQDSVRNNFKSLCLFKAIRWPANGMNLPVTQYWTDMTKDVAFFGMSRLVPVPPSPKCVFLDVSNESERGFFEEMGLLKCMNVVQILEEIVIPALRDGAYDKLNPSFRLNVANLLFRNYYHISPSARSCLSSLTVVPLAKPKDDDSLIFGRPLDILDPQKLALINLYFEDEIRLPERKFYECFSPVLADCGMVQRLNERVVLDRVQSYGRREFEFDLVASRATKLLQMPFQGDCAQLTNLIQVVRENEWLPAQALDRSNSFTNSSKCRDRSEKSVVGHVWHILPFEIDESWRSILGWHDCVDIDVLISQLVSSIAARDIHSIDRTLSYICQHHLVENYADHLLELSFVRCSDGELANAASVCRRGVGRLMPYLHAVEPRFWDDHNKIMRLTKIPERPGLEQLRDVQKALEFKNPLNEQDLDVAIELARIWGIQFHEAIDGLKLPNDNGAFVDVRDLVFNDTPWLSAGTRAIVHPKISRTIADQLKIEPLSELVRKGELGIVDPDEDEFYQREEIADGIRDTLDRYTREHTFHEYLANADDCGSASEVNFFYDGTSYGTKHLLTENLQGLQGPSLLIHNDGGE